MHVSRRGLLLGVSAAATFLPRRWGSDTQLTGRQGEVIDLVRGDGQRKPPGASFGLLMVRAHDSLGPLASTDLRFVVTGRTGSSFAGNHPDNTVQTDADGYASTSELFAGPNTGRCSVEVHLPDGRIGGTFTEVVGDDDGDVALRIVSGNNQSHPLGEAFDALVVEARIDTVPAPGVPVTFELTDDGGTGTTLTNGDPDAAETDESGRAQTRVAAGLRPGAFQVTAISGTSETVFTGIITDASGAGVDITIVSGNGQVTSPNSEFADPLVVLVRNDKLDPVPQSVVHFYADGSAWFPGGQENASVRTDQQGHAASPRLIAGPNPGATSVIAATESGNASAIFKLTIALAKSSMSASGDPDPARDHAVRGDE